MRLRAALVGCGAMSRAWLEAAAKIDDLEIVGLADLDIARAKGRAAEFDLNDASSPPIVETLLAEDRTRTCCSMSSCPRRATTSWRRRSTRAAMCSAKSRWRRRSTRRAISSRAPSAAGRMHAVVQNRRYLAGVRRIARVRRVRRDRRRSPACTPTSSSPRISAAFARRWITCCCSTWRSTASTRCAA